SQPTLLVDQRDRALGAESWWYGLLDPQREHVAVERADFFADDDVDPELGMRPRKRPSFQRSADLVVIRDGEHVHPSGGRPHDRCGRLGAVTPGRVNVEVSSPDRYRALVAGQHAPQRGGKPHMVARAETLLHLVQSGDIV